MARKNLIGITDVQSAQDQTVSPRPDRPIAGFTPPPRGAAPVGGITKTLGNITEKMERAQVLERQMATGQAIVDLDPAMIDSSFVSDRLAIDPQDLSRLVEQIREHGQQVPILVRPHPTMTARFQVAYGHRRLAATRQLGIKVRAVVRDLSDDQLVVSQGQENNSRTDLSFIERALFATRLEDRAFGRETIMAALGVDKAALSRMIGVIRQLPEEIIVAIGPAPGFGRRRWIELTERLAENGTVSDVMAVLESASGRHASSDERFQMAFDRLAHSPRPPAAEKSRLDTDPNLPVKIRKTGNSSTFTFSNKIAPGFDDFVKERLTGLYDEYRKTSGR